MKIIALFVIVLIMSAVSTVHAKEMSFSQDDRDRLIRLETKFEEGQKGVQRQIEEGQKGLQRQIEEGQKGLQRQIDDLKTSNQKQFDDLRAFLFWGFGILFGGMGMLISFVMWDRRTALAPAVDKIKALEEREEVLVKVLKEMARKDANAAEALRHAGLV
ncbi:MAG: hypothetical protein HY805_03330 [Nitrospirae bacterium]|nr:hypothetical protein [Nitrospirota bacterium]